MLLNASQGHGVQMPRHGGAVWILIRECTYTRGPASRFRIFTRRQKNSERGNIPVACNARQKKYELHIMVGLTISTRVVDCTVDF